MPPRRLRSLWVFLWLSLMLPASVHADRSTTSEIQRQQGVFAASSAENDARNKSIAKAVALPTNATGNDVPRAKADADSDDTSTGKARRCTDVGLGFEIDFESSYDDLHGFAQYFSQTMAKQLDGEYDVYFRDMSPTEKALHNAYVVFSVCSAKAKSSQQSPTVWLNQFQLRLKAAMTRSSDLKITPGQLHVLADLSSYMDEKSESIVELQAIPMTSTVALAPPDSNGEPLLHLSIRFKNPGSRPLRVFQLVCHNMKGFRDTVIPIQSPFVVQPGADVMLSINSTIVQTNLVKGQSTSMRLHVVQSSGSTVDIGLVAQHLEPPKTTPLSLDDIWGEEDESTPARRPQNQFDHYDDEDFQDEDHDLQIAGDFQDANERLEKDKISRSKEEAAPLHHQEQAERAHTQQLRVKVQGRDDLDPVLPISTFPSTSWKSVMLFVVVAYTSFFIHSKLRNRSIQWNTRKKQANAKQPERSLGTDRSDDDDLEDGSTESDMMLQKPRSPLPSPKHTARPDPIQLNHAWGSSNTKTSSRSTPTQKQKTKPTKNAARVDETTPSLHRAEHEEPHQSYQSQQSQEAKPYTFVLDKTARLHPKRFESLWEEYVEQKSWKRSWEGRKQPGSAILIALFESQGVMCMASGSVQQVDKYLFYAQEAPESSRTACCIFMEMVVNPITQDVSCQLRGPRDASHAAVEAFATLVDALLLHLLQY